PGRGRGLAKGADGSAKAMSRGGAHNRTRRDGSGAASPRVQPDLVPESARPVNPAWAGSQGRLILIGTVFGRGYREAGPTQGGVRMASRSLAEHLARVPDPRQDSGKRHSLAALLNVVAVAVLCGLRSLEAIAHFGRSLSPATAKE